MKKDRFLETSIDEFVSKMKGTKNLPNTTGFKNDSKYLYKIQDIMFYDHFEASSGGRYKPDMDKIQHNVKTVKELVRNLYFLPLVEFTEKELERDVTYDGGMIGERAVKLIKDLFKMSKRTELLQWAVTTETAEMYFQFILMNKTPHIEVNLYIIRFDESNKICVIIPISLRYVENQNDYILSSHTMYFISKRERDVRYFLEDNSFISNGCSNITALTIIDECIKLALKDVIAGKNWSYSNVDYTIFQMNIFRNLFKSMDSYNGIHKVLVQSYNVPEEYGEIKLPYQEVEQEFDDIMNGCSSKHPIVNLSEKEWKFIHNYINKTYPEYCDIRNALEHPRYGKRLIFRYSDNDENTDHLFLTNYEYFPDLDAARFYLSNSENKNLLVLATMDIVNVSKFSRDHVTDYSIDVKYLNDDFMCSSMYSLFDAAPIVLFKKNELLDLLLDIIDLMVALYDRPQRIKCVKAIKDTSKDKPSKTLKDNSRPDNDVVIERVLVPSKEVKEYIRSMSGTHKEREYVLESWERRGHYRSLPGSDECIWIEPTTCTRRLPLTETEKDIEIRL